MQDSNNTLQLRELVICVDGKDDDVQNWHLSGIHLRSDFEICARSLIKCYKAVMSQNGSLVNIGDKVAFYTDQVSISYKMFYPTCTQLLCTIRGRAFALFVTPSMFACTKLSMV